MVTEIYLDMGYVKTEPNICGSEHYRKLLDDDNLTIQERKYYLGKLYSVEKDTHGNPENFSSNMSLCANNQNERTCERIGKEYGVCKSQIQRFEKYAQGIDAIADIIPELKEYILKSSQDLGVESIAGMIEIPPANRKRVKDMILRKHLVVRPDNIDSTSDEKKEYLVLCIGK